MKHVQSLFRAFAALACAAACVASAQFVQKQPTAPAPAGRIDTRLANTPPRVLPVDRIVAVVNDEVITQNDLNERVNLVVKQFQRQGGQLPPADALSRQILERMINDLLQVQLAKENGIKVDEPTLDKTIDRIAQENNMPMADFRAALEKDGIRYPRFREDIRNEILLARLREREVENGVVVTDAEVETEMARQAKEKTGESEYRLAHVLITVPAQATAETQHEGVMRQHIDYPADRSTLHPRAHQRYRLPIHIEPVVAAPESGKHLQLQDPLTHRSVSLKGEALPSTTPFPLG